jgi:hypothetical protein
MRIPALIVVGALVASCGSLPQLEDYPYRSSQIAVINAAPSFAPTQPLPFYPLSLPTGYNSRSTNFTCFSSRLSASMAYTNCN